MADLHSKILDAPISRSNYLHFHEVLANFGQIIELVPPLGYPGSAAATLTDGMYLNSQAA